VKEHDWGPLADVVDGQSDSGSVNPLLGHEALF